MSTWESRDGTLFRFSVRNEVNGEVIEATRPLPGDCTLQLLTWNDAQGKETMWHSSAHLMAEALEALFPGVKFWVGPPIENGFYYDVDLGGQTLSPADFAEATPGRRPWRWRCARSPAANYRPSTPCGP